MKRLIGVLLLFQLVSVSSAHADWRWHTPKFHIKKVKPFCDLPQCHKVAKALARVARAERTRHFNALKRIEWRHWTSLSIPDCTWYGESGTGPKYARYRYTLPNSTGSGALGKFQFKPRTYFASGKYDDWSPLDQEIAARKEYWKNGTSPWANCG